MSSQKSRHPWNPDPFLRLLEASFDGLGIAENGVVVHVNHRMAEIWGCSREDFIGRSVVEFVAPQDRKRVGEMIQSDFQGAYTHMALRPDGTSFPVEVRGRSMEWEGRTVRVSAVRDITEQEQTTARIREREERLTILTKAVESSNEVVFLTDLDGTFLYVNPAFTRLYGWEAREVVGSKTPRILKSGAYTPAQYREIWDTLLSGQPFEGEVKNRTRNGGLVYIAASSNPVFNDDGEIMGFLAIHSDISARKKHEETVLTIARGVSGSTGETFFRDLAHHLSRAVGAHAAIIGQVAGAEKDRIETMAVEVGGVVQEKFSYSLEGAPCAEALARGECVEASGVQERFPTALGLRRMEAEAYVGKALKDGRGEALGVALVLFKEPLSDPNLAISMLEIFGARGAMELERSRAEKQRRRLEEQLRQAQKMEEIGQLTGGIAHDFQNLLSVILLNTEMMIESLETGETVTLGEVREVEAAAQNAANMTRKLLGFGRRADLSLVVTDLAPVVRGMSSMLRRVIPENIEISIEVGDGAWKVRADPGAIEQILLNLATNARDAMPDGGVLRIRLEKVVVGPEEAEAYNEARPGEYLKLMVQDTGIGMDEELQTRVFEPFFTTKPLGEGTGLGLAMAYGLVRQHEGFLRLDSCPGKGTTVSLYLPLVVQDAQGKSREEPRQPAAGGTETILVVEDQPALRRTLKMVLERSGYRVEVAEDGKAGLEALQSRGNEIDLVLSDLVMPRMGGVELYRSLRREGRAVPVIMASGYAGKSAAGLAELDPDVPVLKKPWKPRELLRLIREILDRGRGSDQS